MLSSDARDASSLRRWLTFLYAVPLAGLVGIVVYAAAAKGFMSVFSVALLVAAGAWVCGGLLGFLFGIPRNLSSSDNPKGAAGVYRSNTNLEEISDWLTKILVGLGLVELARIVKSARRLVDFISPSFGSGAGSSSFALAILVLFAASGFLALYIVTRVYVGVLFARTEVSLGRLGDELAKAKDLADQAEASSAQRDGDGHGDGDDGAGNITEATIRTAPSTVAAVDPVSAVAAARTSVVETILELYRTIYAKEAETVDAAASQLRADGYLDAVLANLASALLRVTEGALQSGALSEAQLRTLIDSAQKFARNVGRVASLNFESHVEQALRALRDAEVQRRPRDYNPPPDVVVRSGGKTIFVEAYLPQARPLHASQLQKRIDTRLKWVNDADAAGLLLVVPDGIELPPNAADLPPGVVVRRLEEVRRGAADGDLLSDPHFQ